VKNDAFENSAITSISISKNGVDTSNIVFENNNEIEIDDYIVEDIKWQTGFMTQFVVLTKRRFAQSVKERFMSPIYVGILLGLCLLAGLEWFQTDRTEARVQDRLGIVSNLYAIV